MNRHDERQLVHYVAAHDKACEHGDEKEAARIRKLVNDRLHMRLLREAGMGQARIVKGWG